MARSYRSEHHPEDTPPAWLAIRYQLRPVAFGLLLVMIGAVSAVLQGVPILRPTLIATAVAYGAGASIGLYRMHQTPAELVIRGSFATIRSVWDVAAKEPVEHLSPVISSRMSEGEFMVGIGDAITPLTPSEWPRFEEMRAAVQQAAAEFARLSQPPLH